MFKEAFNKLIEERETNIFKVSKETNIPVATMYDWAKGKTEPKFESVVKLSKHFGVSVEYFAD